MTSLAGLLCGTIGEALLSLDAQVRHLEEVLIADFRVVAFLSEEMAESKWRVAEERLRALPGTREVRFVSRDGALESLREQDPELARSVALLGENPLQSAFEIELAPEAVSRTASWARSAGELPGIGDIRFKPRQVQAVVQCQFYSRFLRLVSSLAAFFWLAGCAAALWKALAEDDGRAGPGGLRARLAAAALSCAAGMGVVLLAALPLRSSPAAWASPYGWSQALLLLVGTLGALLMWQREQPRRPHEGPRGAAREALAGTGLA